VSYSVGVLKVQHALPPSAKTVSLAESPEAQFKPIDDPSKPAMKKLSSS
jgi:hypothetical protein